MTKRLDQRGIETAYLYDLLGRLTRKQDARTSPTIVEDYGYDAAGRLIAALLSRGGNEQADTRFFYDGLGRATRESQEIKAGTARNIDSLYHREGMRTKLTYPGGTMVNSTYDALGRRVEKIDHTGESAVTTRWYLDGWSALEERDGDDALGNLHQRCSAGRVRPDEPQLDR